MSPKFHFVNSIKRPQTLRSQCVSHDYAALFTHMWTSCHHRRLSLIRTRTQLEDVREINCYARRWNCTVIVVSHRSNRIEDPSSVTHFARVDNIARYVFDMLYVALSLSITICTGLSVNSAVVRYSWGLPCDARLTMAGL